MASVFTVHEAKTHLSRLIALVEKGEDVVISRGRDPVVRVVPYDAPPRAQRRAGTRKTSVPFDMSFFEPLPEEHLRAWEGRD